MTIRPSKSFLFNTLKNELQNYNAKTGIDIACGDAKNSHFFKTQNYIGIDKNNKLIQSNKKKFNKKKFLSRNILSLKKDKKILGDIVVSTNTLAHIKNNKRILAMKNIISLVKKNGNLICEINIVKKRMKEENDLFVKNFISVKKIYYKNYFNFFLEKMLINKYLIFIYKILIALKIIKLLELLETATSRTAIMNHCLIYICKKKK
jgi:hypothetical protein